MRYIGITHYTVGSHSDLARIIEREKLDFVQLNYSAGTRDAEQRLLPLAADRGVAVLVNRPFEDGKMFEAVSGQACAAVGGGHRLHELGPDFPEVRDRASGRDVRDSGHRQGAASCRTISPGRAGACRMRSNER